MATSIDLHNPAFWAAYLGGRIAMPDPDADAMVKNVWIDPRIDLFALPFATTAELHAYEDTLFRTSERLAMAPANDAASLALAEHRLGDLYRDHPEDRAYLREQLLRHMAWQQHGPAPHAIALRFPDGWTWTILFEAAPSIGHELSHPSLDAPLFLGCDDAHFVLPILRWQEVISLSTACDSPWAGLLLAATAWLCADDDRERIAAWLTSQWRERNVLAPDRVTAVVSRQLWPSDLRWWPSERGYVVDARHSLRGAADTRWAQQGINGHAILRRFFAAAGL